MLLIGRGRNHLLVVYLHRANIEQISASGRGGARRNSEGISGAAPAHFLRDDSITTYVRAASGLAVN